MKALKLKNLLVNFLTSMNKDKNYSKIYLSIGKK
jgi:hypothetical protein